MNRSLRLVELLPASSFLTKWGITFLLCWMGVFSFTYAQPQINVDQVSGRPPLEVNFEWQETSPQDSTLQLERVVWTFGGKDSIESMAGTHLFEKVGKFTLEAKGIYSDGHEEVISQKVEVKPLITNDAVVFGLLCVVLALIFVTSGSSHPFFQKFYKFVPALLLCYFVPALLNWPLGWISGEFTQLYNPVTSRYLLPAALILLCVSIDLKGIINLGWKAIVMFFTATLGIIIGGPIALMLISAIAPDLIGASPDELWRGLSTVAGSWIGGGANQAAMKEIYEVSDRIFSSMIVIDVIVANIWMGFLLYGASKSGAIDKWFKADTRAIDDLRNRVEGYSASIAKNPTTTDLFRILAVAFGGTALAHIGADAILPVLEPYERTLSEMGLSSLVSRFFWLIVIATTVGVGLSFTPARKLEGVGASKIGSVFIYLLVASIGMKMNIGEVFDNLGAFFIGIVWMLVHVSLLLLVGKLIKAPFFFTAVGSQANVGGAASAPVVASAFSPALAPVGVLMAVLGYALGTYGAIVCAELMRVAAGG
ncbi:DUF819 family protein [Pontibacter sp. G13]|uniref:DUF819 family protein n=1 Tax=Pontibacter sp. G13 TaxID=3074898 RepID=UPI00288B791B|nr:DUF819 family protein [Pontibacter sp. G13]WNJ19245.1 DUF819 family protein [Pontibacter sp. G13]